MNMKLAPVSGYWAIGRSSILLSQQLPSPHGVKRANRVVLLVLVSVQGGYRPTCYWRCHLALDPFVLLYELRTSSRLPASASSSLEAIPIRFRGSRTMYLKVEAFWVSGSEFRPTR